MTRVAWTLGLSALCIGAPARADIVHLMSGSSHECIVLRATDEWVKYETAIGVVSLPRNKVAGITREPEETNLTLRRGWQAERAAAEARRRARKRKAQVERLTRKAQGLVKYQEEWVSPEERDARRAAERAAQAAAAALGRDEAAAGHQFRYGVWMTPATAAAVTQAEAELRTHRDRAIALHRESALLQDQISTSRTMALQDPGLEAMEARAEQIARLKKQQDAVGADIREVRRAGDSVAARIKHMTERARTRLRRLLIERGASADAVQYIAAAP